MSEVALTSHPYERLTPDVVMDALVSVGLYGDGRLMSLSSYENRVYQAHLEDGRVVVAKFYRPERWRDAQIAEEHAFAGELTQAEVPVVAPLVLDGATLHHHEGFAFAVCPRQGGRRPELDDPEVLERIGRFLARIHNVGAAKSFACRPTLDVQTFGWEPRQWLAQSDMLPLDVKSTCPASSRCHVDSPARRLPPGQHLVDRRNGHSPRRPTLR
jgi:Ser/Thr protein kinase RdoA (MazF antagonist)